MAVDDREWLEADGLGGFASGTVSGRRTRKYHALLLAAMSPPTDRYVLVNGMEAFVTTSRGSQPLSTQHYVPDVLHPDGYNAIESFVDDPWPTWTYRGPGGIRIVQELFAAHEQTGVVVSWRLAEQNNESVTLMVRLLISGRSYHSLHRENPVFNFEADTDSAEVRWRPYQGLPQIRAITDGSYTHDPLWYRQFLYIEERNRGLDCVEDLASPGRFEFDLSRGPAVCILTTDGPNGLKISSLEHAFDVYDRLQSRERQRRSTFKTRIERSADAYLVRRGTDGRTIIAGYPWFSDWGRDTFIALRGLCLAGDALDEAEKILLGWATMVSRGMLPNRFPEEGSAPAFNSVDASLWFVVAADQFLQAAASAERQVAPGGELKLRAAIEAILSGYAEGTRFGIRADEDGLLACGEDGVQLTWMDAKIGDWVVTPRIGKPVEVQALWINALWIGSHSSDRWQDLYKRARDAFVRRFWNEEQGCLFDVVDVNHIRGRCDGSVRPNQIFAVGGLPLCLLDKRPARSVVQTVEERLLTPLGLRTLDRSSPDYKAHYAGDLYGRDAAYHQGTVWPWLMGPFVEAWLRVHGNTQIAARRAGKRFLQPLLDHLNDAGIGHVSEIADGDPPHTPRGCPFQAWSLGELMRAMALTSNGLGTAAGR